MRESRPYRKADFLRHLKTFQSSVMFSSCKIHAGAPVSQRSPLTWRETNSTTAHLVPLLTAWVWEGLHPLCICWIGFFKVRKITPVALRTIIAREVDAHQWMTEITLVTFVSLPLVLWKQARRSSLPEGRLLRFMTKFWTGREQATASTAVTFSASSSTTFPFSSFSHHRI